MTAPATLEPKLLDVLRLIADGHSNRQIGNMLHITEDGAKRRSSVLQRQLGARDRAHAVAIGFQRGYLGRHAATCDLRRPRVCDCGVEP